MKILKKMITLLFLSFIIIGYGKDNKVFLPLNQWEKMLEIIEQGKKKELPRFQYSFLDRAISGVFKKGLFEGKLTTKFQVFARNTYIQIPMLDGTASIKKVTLNGKKTSLGKEGRFYTIGISRPGSYTVVIDFYLGKELTRFERRLNIRLPVAGGTRLSIMIPEKNIVPKLENGVLVSKISTRGGTLLIGNLDGSGVFDLFWMRRVTHKTKKKAKTKVQMNTLFNIKEAVISGMSVFKVKISEGEIDRFDLKLPKNIEIIRVTGEAVLQWKTDIKKGGRLTILLRYLVEKETSIRVYYQFPVESKESVKLFMPLPFQNNHFSGNIGIQSQPGLSIKIKEQAKAKLLEPRNYPPDLTALTNVPLVYGFQFKVHPDLIFGVIHHQHLDLTSTLIDDMEASTVFTEDGLEMTKIKLRIRNHTKQYLKMSFSSKITLTHSLIDGRPIRPAVIKSKEGKQVLLFPLRQSERYKKKARYHTVREGDNLSKIAQLYYSDPTKWKRIQSGNELERADALMEGQRLRIPFIKGTRMKESSFLIEIAYKNKEVSSFGLLGRKKLNLPELDVGAMKITWHLYLPRKVEPLSFGTNLIQYSYIRYDPFQRLENFIRKVFYRRVWAGGGSYSKKTYYNILKQRKMIYKDEFSIRKRERSVLTTFPYVGTRYRFKRNLLGKNVAYINLFYTGKGFGKIILWFGFIFSFILSLQLFKEKKKIIIKKWIYIGSGFLILFFLAYYILGIHRRIIWGIALALSINILRIKWKPFWKRIKKTIKSPWTISRFFSIKRIIFILVFYVIFTIILSYPLLFSSSITILLLIWWLRINNRQKKGGAL